MTVYILHLESPFHHARHYTGFSKNGRTLKVRVGHHENGTARCKFTDALHRNGIHFTLARIFKQADRNFERKLKKTHNVSRYCPVCNPENWRNYEPKTETT